MRRRGKAHADAASPQTTQRLMRAAEQLFAEQGISAVRLQSINASAGVRNNAAVHYYFGDRDGLLEAIVEHHLATVEEWRAGALDDLEAEGRTSDVASLVGVGLRPMARKLATPGGRDYLRIAAELLVRYGPHSLFPGTQNRQPSVRRLRTHLLAALDHLATEEAIERLEQAMMTAVVCLADRARAHADGGDGADYDDDAFVERLCVTITAALCAPSASASRS